MKTKMFAIVILSLSFFALVNFASAGTAYFGGSGTAGDPYEINSVANLMFLAKHPDDYNKCFILTADINLADDPCTNAIIAPDNDNTDYDFEGNAFTGVFDGNNHVISNLTIDSGGAGNDFLGLFGQIDAAGQVKNLSLQNVAITGGINSVYLGGLVGINSGTISNCSSSGTVSGGDYLWGVGGLAGYTYDTSNISDCWSTANVSSGSGCYWLGGLVGYNGGNMDNCYATGTVGSGDYSRYLGGLTGLQNFSSNVTNCHASGNVTCADHPYYLGGLIGLVQNSTVSDCWSSGTVSAETEANNIGGLMGQNYNGHLVQCHSTGNVTAEVNSQNLGGLAGTNSDDGYIEDFFATGNVASGPNSTALGGFVGFNDSSVINSCYSTGNATGGRDSNNIGGMVGDNGSGSGNLENCYSTGDANGGGGTSNNIGGLVGNNNGSIYTCYSTGTAGGGSAHVRAFVGTHSVINGSPDIISDCYYLAGSGPNDDNGTPLTAAQMTQQARFTGWNFPDTWFIAGKGATPKLYWQLIPSKCTATAGTKPNSGKVSCSGTFDAALSVIDISSKIIRLSICSPYFRQDFNFPLDANTFSLTTLKYKCARTENGIKESLACDLKKYTFAFSASNLDLTGVSCPAVAKIDMGDYNSIGYLDEAIVNGPKTPLPIKFMMGVDNVLRVDKFAIKHNAKPNSDQLTASGGFAVQTEQNMGDSNFTVTLPGQQFVIPKGNFAYKNVIWSCSNVPITGGHASASFNYNLCAWTLTIKDANIPTLSSPVRFGIAFGDFNEVQPVTIP